MNRYLAPTDDGSAYTDCGNFDEIRGLATNMHAESQAALTVKSYIQCGSCQVGDGGTF